MMKILDTLTCIQHLEILNGLLKIKLEKDFDNFSPNILNNKNKKIIKINCIKYLINFIYLGF